MDTEILFGAGGDFVHKNVILVVDDSELNRSAIAAALKDEYDISEASNGVEAIDYIFKNTEDITLIILDIIMPQLNGIEVMKILKSDSRTADIPVIMLTAADSNEEYCFRLGAVDFIRKPFNKNVVLSRVNAHVYRKRYTVEGDEKEENSHPWDTSVCMLFKMATLPDTGRLSSEEQVKDCVLISKLFAADVCQKYSREYGSLSRHTERISRLIPLRDIGKFMVKEGILRKKEQLGAEDFAEIMKHCKYGIDMVDAFGEGISGLNKELLTDIIWDHHENYDGSGYPKGKKGNAISPAGRLAAVLDCYFGMTSKRVYREAFTHEETIAYIRSQKNLKFDGRLVDVFVNLPFGRREGEDIK